MKRSWWFFGLSAILFGYLIAHAGCARGPTAHCWMVDSLVKVFPDDSQGTNKASDKTWLIARNGHATIQIAVRSEQTIPDLRVEISEPESAGRKLAVRTRWADYVSVGSNPPGTPFDEVARSAPFLFPDPLREDFPFELKGNTTHAIWITVYAPGDAAPGDYDGEAVFFSGKERVASTRLSARVTRATVPKEQKLKVTNWFNLDRGHLSRFYEVGDEYSERYWELLENLGRVMADHKQNVIITPVRKLALPSAAGGAIRYDFTRLDRWVETFEKAGLIGTIEGGHLLSRRAGYMSPMMVPAYVIEDGKVVDKALDPDDPRAERFFQSFLSALYAHIKDKGWENRYIQHIHDEPHDREAPVYRRFAKLVLEHLPGIPTIDAVSLDQRIEFFADVCDIWVPVLGSFDHELDLIRDHVNKGGGAWFYTCISPQGRYLNRFIDYSLLKVRLLHWFNFRHDFAGFLHWGGNYWGPRPFQNVQTVINSNRTLLPAGDNAIVYPDPEKNSVLSSIRLEAMREGIEDYELLTVLAAGNPDKARELARAAIPHVNDYVRDAAAFRKLHRQLLEAEFWEKGAPR